MIHDLAEEEAFGVVYTIAPSPVQPGLMWVGTDDGLIHLTRDEGRTWKNITPKELTAWSKVSMIEASPHDAGTAYAAVDRHRLDDYTAHVYRTSDFGATWTEIVNGFPRGTFVRAVREDPVKGDCCTPERNSVFTSRSIAGDHWSSLQLNLPRAPIHDLVVHERDLVVATHGRSFWVLDDLSPLRQAGGQTGTPAEACRSLADPAKRQYRHAAAPRNANGRESAGRRGHRLCTRGRR